MERFGTVCVMIEDKNGDGICLEALLKDLAYEFSHNTKVQKIAVVTDERWFRMITDLKSLFTTTSVESYKKKNRLDKIEWIMN